MPALGVIVMLPSLPPLQVTGVLLLIARVGAFTLVMVTVFLTRQPLASTTVTLYVPTPNPVAVWVVCAGLVFHV